MLELPKTHNVLIEGGCIINIGISALLRSFVKKPASSYTNSANLCPVSDDDFPCGQSHATHTLIAICDSACRTWVQQEPFPHGLVLDLRGEGIFLWSEKGWTFLVLLVKFADCIVRASLSFILSITEATGRFVWSYERESRENICRTTSSPLLFFSKKHKEM